MALTGPITSNHLLLATTYGYTCLCMYALHYTNNIAGRGSARTEMMHFQCECSWSSIHHNFYIWIASYFIIKMKLNKITPFKFYRLRVINHLIVMLCILASAKRLETHTHTHAWEVFSFIKLLYHVNLRNLFSSNLSLSISCALCTKYTGV